MAQQDLNDMRVLVLHNTYQQPGGEDRVVQQEAELLRGAGHNVRVEIISNDGIGSIPSKVHAFFSAPFDASRQRWLTKITDEFRPDIVHIHNFFPLLTPAAHMAAATAGLPVVQTLHNFRLLCANGLFLRHGEVCRKCVTGSRYWAVAHRCYRGSLPGSLAVVRMQEFAFRHRVWSNSVSRFIALTEFSRGEFIAGGLPPEKIVVKPNFVFDPGTFEGPRNGALFVGRISREKGIETLVRAWHRISVVPLTVIGDGPLLDELKGMAPPNVTFLGSQPKDTVFEYMANAGFLIIPSIWFEGMPVTFIEALAVGLPILASDIGALHDLVRPGGNGMHFRAGDTNDLVAKVRLLTENPALLIRLGSGARACYEQLYAPERNKQQLEKIYSQAIADEAEALRRAGETDLSRPK